VEDPAEDDDVVLVDEADEDAKTADEVEFVVEDDSEEEAQREREKETRERRMRELQEEVADDALLAARENVE